MSCASVPCSSPRPWFLPSIPPRQPRHHVPDRQEFARAAGPPLQLDLAVGQALRAYDHMPGYADEVGGGELGPWSLVAVVIQDFASRRLEVAEQASAGLVGG